LEALETRVVPSQQGVYVQTNLVSDIPGLASFTDPNLKNPWGVSVRGASPFWVSDAAAANSALYTVTASGAVSVPRAPVTVPAPTGQVQNSAIMSFLVGGTTASFIFASLNGSIYGWNNAAGNAAVQEATGATGSVYTGLAISGAGDVAAGLLYAANDSLGRIDVYDASWAPVTLGSGGFGTFTDPDLPAGLVPFNVQNINGAIYVTYAPAGRPAQTGATEGQGAVAVFDATGHFQTQLIAGSKLAAPWGITLAPAGFGPFGGDLLVGNFAYNVSEINAFDPTTGDYVGTIADAAGNPILNQGLWAIKFGNGGSAGSPNILYFAAGINAEQDGLFGAIQVAPTLSPAAPLVPNLPNGIQQTFSTVPDSGDQNPYGVAFVPQDYHGGGLLHPGDILVSNFNNSDNLQGTGTTIVAINPTTGQRSVFFQGDTHLGLTTALAVLKNGFVIVGNVPTSDGTFDTIGRGSLLILDSNGHLVETLANRRLLDGPWDLAVNDQGDQAQVFVANVLNGTVTRIDLRMPRHGAPVVQHMVRIASGYAHAPNDAALVVGPTGLAYDARQDILYVASTDDNAIFAIPNAGETHRDRGKGQLVYQDDVHLHGPLGLVLAPNGDLIVANGDAVNEDDTQPSELVEFTPHGQFVGQFSLSTEPGAAFGIAVDSSNGALRFAAVNDADNTLEVWTFATGS
jgi:uncharacterized protein (TIGR03118 family)